MRSTFYGLEISRTGLYTAQNELNLTGHNISNVDTEGYTRQRLSTAAIPAQYANVQFAVDNRATAGRGVEALTVDQIRDAFVDAKIREENSATSYWNTKMQEFSMVEDLYDSMLETSTTAASIWNSMAEFRTALSSLESSPSSKDLRTNVMSMAVNLTETFNYTYDKLVEHHENLNDSIAVQVDQINEMAEAIANLNKQIFGYELTGEKANDLRDSRNLLLDELSCLVNIDYFEDTQGYMTVTISGRELVQGVEYYQLAVDPQGTENQLDVLANADIISYQYSVTWADEMGKPSKNPNDKVQLQSGQLKAYIDLRDGSTETNIGIPYAVDMLNQLARQMAQEINAVHREGYTVPFTSDDVLGMDTSTIRLYDPATGGLLSIGNMPIETVNGLDYYSSTQGINFFEVNTDNDYSKITAGNFAVSSEIINNVYLIAASDAPVTVEGVINQDGTTNQGTGNALNLKRITALYDNENPLGFAASFEDTLKEMVTNIATQQDNLKQMDASQQTRLYALEQQRASISGVSLDEEMTNVVRFTHAYNANARVITAIDEELDVLINRMGVVGRG